jgi:hypothetical protein
LPCTAGQNRFSLRSSQIAQLKCSFLGFDYFTAPNSMRSSSREAAIQESLGASAFCTVTDANVEK